MYEEEFRELGLTDNETRVYFTLLKQGVMSPGKVAQKLGLHRGYIYDVLERLSEKEFVNTLQIDGTKHYQANSPKNIQELLQGKAEHFQTILPQLNSLIESKKESVKVELHKGKRVYRTLLKDILSSLKNGGEVLLIGIDDEKLLSEVEPIYLKQYLTAIKERNIKEKLVVAKGNKKIKNPNVKYKEIEPSIVGNTAQLIYGNKVAIFIDGIPRNLIIIESLEVVETYKKQFEVFWNLAD